MRQLDGSSVTRDERQCSNMRAPRLTATPIISVRWDVSISVVDRDECERSLADGARLAPCHENRPWREVSPGNVWRGHFTWN